MPVTFWVLSCSKCFLFQVHQSKKSKNWVCKVCSCKQSFLKVFAEGSAKECREIVQKLNKQGVQRQMELPGFGKPDLLRFNPNKYLHCETAVKEDLVFEDNDSESQENKNIDTEEISYKLHPYSNSSDSRAGKSTGTGENFSHLNFDDAYLKESTSSVSNNSATIPSQCTGSKWDVYL
ncbi:unnamed protein product [Trichobilharzia szidati]|nr:unnamed protein product [Trichobilharzia szidati]